MYGIVGREITRYMIMYGVYKRFWQPCLLWSNFRTCGRGIVRTLHSFKRSYTVSKHKHTDIYTRTTHGLMCQVGSEPELGCWDPEDGLSMSWQPGHAWQGHLELPLDTEIEAKVRFEAKFNGLELPINTEMMARLRASVLPFTPAFVA